MSDDEQEPGSPWQRPQAIMLTFCATHMLGRHEAVYSGSLVDVLAGAGVGEHASRSTLARMARRDLLTRYRRGKRVYFGLTDHAVSVLQAGGRRIEADGAVNRDWDGNWTLLGFSLPESRRTDRRLLRARLVWAGFGLLQNGLWIAPYAVDVQELLSGLDVTDHVNAFRAQALQPTDIDEMIADAWDLESLAKGYRGFLSRWDAPNPMADAPDDLARQLLLMTEWLLLIRKDPRLPVGHLPADWPAVRAEHVMIRHRTTLIPAAELLVKEHLDRIPVPAT